MKTALTVIFIIASILLIILVLMQEGKEAGLGSFNRCRQIAEHTGARTKVVQEGTLIKVTTFFTIVFFRKQQQSLARFIEKISTS